MKPKKLADNTLPLVSIGIPTYNRSALLKRAIESALNQDYGNLEVIVSDNASTDDTESICRSFCEKDGRLKYIRQSSNRGPVANFTDVLKNAAGQFFMWLGDDDWIDLAYISTCVQQLASDTTLALVSGAAQYYRNGKKTHDGHIFDLLQNKWWNRVISYYINVTDNGMFYGVMQTEHIRIINIPNTMGGDWLVLANIVALGKAQIIPEISVHRELGGVSQSYQKIASTTGLPKFQVRFPMLSIAAHAWLDIVAKGIAFKSRPILTRHVIGAVVFIVISLKFRTWFWLATARSYLRRLLLRNT